MRLYSNVCLLQVKLGDAFLNLRLPHRALAVACPCGPCVRSRFIVHAVRGPFRPDSVNRRSSNRTPFTKSDRPSRVRTGGSSTWSPPARRREPSDRIYARFKATRRAAVVALALLASCGGGTVDDRVGSPTTPSTTTVPATTTLPQGPAVLAYDLPCTANECEVSAAEIVGQIVVVANCVLLDRWDGTTPDAHSYAIVFPFGAKWSDTEQGVLLADGSIAHVGDWISTGGGATPLANIGVLGTVDGEGVRTCAAASEQPGDFLDLSPNGSVTILTEAPAGLD